MESRLLSKKLSWPIQIVIWLFAFYIAWNVIPHGYQKLMMDPGVVGFFNSIGVPVYGMIAAGIVEVFGSLLLFIPRISFYGAVPLIVVMLTAGYYSNWDMVTVTAAFLSAVIAVLSKPRFLGKRPEITKISI